jgi:hypothetical protein
MKNAILIIMLLTLLFSACSQKYPLDLGGGYKIEYDANSYFCLVDKNNTEMVGGHITKFKFDSIYIVIEQKPVDLILKDTYNNPEWNLPKRDKLFEESTLRLYWIVNKKEKGVYSFDKLTRLARYSNVYGPFKKDEYLRKREELNVPKELELTEEE